MANAGFISDFIINSCDGNKKLKLKEFPNLNFYKFPEDLAFEFTYKDLLIK